MNNQKRERLKLAREYLTRASDIVSGVLDDEQDCLDNTPDNLQYSDRYENMEATIGRLEDAIESIERTDEYINEASK